MDKKKIIVVGAGPAGVMAAIRAGQLGQEVVLIEKNSSIGRKILLSGKGRCNLTNAADQESFFKRFSRNGQFLRDAFKKFFNTALIAFFEKNGLKLKTERQLRVFPVTDSSASVVEVLEKELSRQKVEIIYNSAVQDILVGNSKIKGVILYNAKRILADKVIMATGGLSYPSTGSTGDGFRIAQAYGHRIAQPLAALVALETKQPYVKNLQGLTLKNIKLAFTEGKKKLVSDVGELLFTDFGISGPLVLTMSGLISEWLAKNKETRVEIDLKPALSNQQLDTRFLREFKNNPRKNIRNILKDFLPIRLVDTVLGIAKITPDRKSSHITQAERLNLVTILKAMRLDILRARPIQEAMVTRGGVDLRDINPRTMESRLIKGLYFVGELIDVDADTGGFNLQAAFSTGYLAGESASFN